MNIYLLKNHRINSNCKKKNNGSGWMRIIYDWELYMMIAPSVILVILFSYFPMYAIIVAFKKFSIVKGIWKSPWADSYGFQHFIDLFTYPFFGSILRNTIIISFLKLVLLAFPPVILAVVFNEIKDNAYKRITQTVSYLPHFVSWIVIGGIIINLLKTDGALNIILRNIGLIQEPVDFMAKTWLFWPLLVISELWKEVGWGSIIYLGIIATIDQNLYEAIEIDGGGRFAKVFHITWPSLKGTFMILFILNCAGLMSGGGGTFDQIIVMGSPMVKEVSNIISVFVLHMGIENAQYSFAAAVGLFQNIINLILLVSANYLSNKLTQKSLF